MGQTVDVSLNDLATDLCTFKLQLLDMEVTMGNQSVFRNDSGDIAQSFVALALDLDTKWQDLVGRLHADTIGVAQLEVLRQEIVGVRTSLRHHRYPTQVRFAIRGNSLPT